MKLKQTRNALVLSWVLLFSLAVQAAEPNTSKSLSVAMGEEICQTLERGSASFHINTWTETTAEGKELLKFYKEAHCLPVWSHENGIDQQAFLFIDALKKASSDGLDSHNPQYHLDGILELIALERLHKNDASLLAQLDILLSDAYMTLGKHLYYGVLSASEAPEKWKISPKTALDISVRLKKALERKTIVASLEQLSPTTSEYQRLKGVLPRYLKMQDAGEWKSVESCDTDASCMGRIKEHLRIEGDLSLDDDDSMSAYQSALKKFQRRHGILVDGKAGQETLAKLNISLEDKITAIRLNMERWRWMPRVIEKNHIAVNIPDFTLSVVQDNNVTLKMKAILGKKERSTPIFNATMYHMIANPYWHVPSTILKEDILPTVRNNVHYLQKEKIRVFKSSDREEKVEIDPLSIDWQKADAAAFPYVLRQDAGAKNSLGTLKFIFPNTYDIYIHDTPKKNLFERKNKYLSSGCIRIEDPLGLANHLLNPRTLELSTLGENEKIPLPRAMKVYISYWTVWVDDQNETHFRDDFYGYDKELAKMLRWNSKMHMR